MTDKPLIPESWAPHVKAWQDEQIESMRRMTSIALDALEADAWDDGTVNHVASSDWNAGS